MLDWLKTGSNFKWITGSLASENPVQSGKALTKVAAFKSLADDVNKKTSSEWDPSVAKSRYESWMSRYRKAKKLSNTTGWGVESDDETAGIKTIADKLDSICPRLVQVTFQIYLMSLIITYYDLRMTGFA
jgi:hypothetical protein